MDTSVEPRSGTPRGVAIWVAVAVAIAVAALVLGTIALLRDDSTSTSTAQPSTTSEVSTFALRLGVPTIVSAEQLAQYGAAHSPIYWAGPQKNRRYELTATSNGAVFVRYLTQGASAGDRQSKYLSVATYSVPNGYQLLSTKAKQSGQQGTVSQSGALMLTSAADNQRAYFAFPDNNFQVEVFAPGDGQAKTLVSNGSLVVVK